MTFTYFQGPQVEMIGLATEAVTCALCGAAGPCFSLGDTHCPELCPEPYRQATDTRSGQYGCFDCLHSGRFEFWHDTEVGLLFEHGLEKYYNYHQPPPPDFPAAALTELRRTPQYRSCQQGRWLVHCNDFMLYLGAWEPAEFRRRAPDGDGRALFTRMAREFSSMWDGAVENVPGESSPTGWGDAGCYAFRCRHCGELRAHCDWF